MFYDQGLTAPHDSGYCFGPVVVKPSSRGWVKLRAPLPDSKPRVLCNFLETEDDRRSIIAGIRMALEIAAQEPLKKTARSAFSVPAGDSDAEILDFVRRAGQTVYHPTSTCAIGSVVDPQLRVYGIDGLRVADASVMPTITRANTNAATIMIGERAADLIRRLRADLSRPNTRRTLMSTTEQAVANLLNEEQWTGKIFSDGWIDAPETIDTIEPATGVVLGTAGVANAASVAASAKSAARAQRAWAATPMAERVAVVRRAGELLELYRAEIADWMIRESGSIDGKVAHEIGASIGQLEQAASLTSDQLERELTSPVPGRTSTARRAPIGVVGVITPVELPACPRDAVARPRARARQRRRAQGRPEHARHRRRRGRAHLRGGRPAVGCPARALRGARGRTGAGRGSERPDDLLHRLDKDRARGRRDRRPVAEARRARARRQQPADRARRRGHRGCIVRGRVGLVPAPGPDLPLREQAPRPRVDRGGLPRRAATRASHLPVGNPATGQVALGPLINEKQAASVQRIVDETVAVGATALIGGTRDGLFFPPTVLRDVRPGMAAFDEEIFGPVAAVTTFKTDEEAVELANATEYGLLGGGPIRQP